jgi:hypothetical protein
LNLSAKEKNWKRIGNVLNTARRTAAQYKELTGKQLGIMGEAAEYEAARILGLRLSEVRQEGFDVRKGRKPIQIEGRVIGPDANPGQRIGSIKLNKDWDKHSARRRALKASI